VGLGLEKGECVDLGLEKGECVGLGLEAAYGSSISGMMARSHLCVLGNGRNVIDSIMTRDMEQWSELGTWVLSFGFL
jgi:hypothetical protein